LVEMSESEGGPGFRILALLWHAPHEVIAAGGFRRTYEIFERTPDRVEVYAVDDEPSFLRGIDCPNTRIREYRIPRMVRKLEENHFWFERVLEWMLATVIMVYISVRLRISGDKFDAVFVPSSEQIPTLLAGILAKHLFRAPLIACNLNIDIFPLVLRAPLTRLHNLADAVIAISEHLACRLKAYGLRAPVSLNGVGLDVEVIDKATAGVSGKEYEAVFVGRHDTEKGIFDLVEIWNLVVKAHPEARLVIIGSCNPGNKVKLADSIHRYGLGDNVVLMGIVGDEEKYSLIKRSKLCLFPSHVEEWGIVPQEALACGLPVVVYDLPVYEENIKRCVAALAAPVGDIEGMARLTCELLADESDRTYRSFETTGPEFVKEFDWDEVASREFKIITGHPVGRTCGQQT
jgi:glycosyltransferase involved in cell wall biosynthesis